MWIFTCRFRAVIALTFVTGAASFGAVYEVGPGKPYTTIGAAPWASLQPGDAVRIHYRSTPYREKWVICRQGTAAAPITVTGVPGPNGERPVIEGIGAVTAPGLNYWSEQRGIVKIGGANVPADTMPKHIVIEGLEIRGARTTNTFTDDTGAVVPYTQNASTIYVEKCDSCTIRNNVLHDAGNVIFVASNDTETSRNILIQGNVIYNGGNVGSIREHNIYTAAAGIIFERNHLGRMLAGAGGNNLKDRSSGTVIRYNWIEGGNRQLDLVDAEDSIQIRTDPAYRAAHVYGNVLVEHAADGNRQMVHYGGDGVVANYRKGTLYFYNNTLVSYRTDRTSLFRGSTNEETIDARSNVFYSVAAGSTVSLADQYGIFNLSRNYIKAGWVNSFGTWSGAVNDDGTMINANSPGFVDEAGMDFRPSASSPLADAGGQPNPAVLPQHAVTLEYVKHAAATGRSYLGLPDIGAFEGASTGPVNQPPVASFTASPASGAAPLTVSFNGGASHDPDGTISAYSWQYGTGAVSSGVSVTYTYTTPGTYTALLRVTDNSGATASVTRTITVTAPVNQLPVASFTATPVSGVAPLAVSFNASASSDPDGTISAYSWQYGTGAVGSGVSGTYTYATPGTYTALLRVTDNSGATASVTRTITVTAPANRPPVASFTASPVSGVAPLTVSFNASASSDPDGTISTYSWQYGTGAVGSGVSGTYTYTRPGTYTALLRVTDNSGATASVTRTITVTAPATGLQAPTLMAVVNSSTVRLSWTTVTGAHGYVVERRTGSGPWARFLITGYLSHSDQRVPGTYSYRVRGYKGATNSPWSNVVTVAVQ